MKLTKLFLFYFLFISIISCSKEDGQIDFTLMQVNDVYEIAPIQGGEIGGMARVETVHQELLNENENTMLVMAGDFLNPSLLGSLKYEGKRIKGRQMIEVMNAMNFNLVAFGNHEFDVKEDELEQRMSESNFPWISGNVFHKKGDRTVPFQQNKNGVFKDIKGSFIKEFQDSDGTEIKVGFISVCIPSNPKGYVHYEDIYTSIQRDYERIKDSVDIVFGLTHVSIAQDKKIAEMLPNLPLIMGGHEHDNMRIKVGKSVITKADANAKSAYIHRISYDKQSKMVSIESELKEIDSSIIEDVRVGTIVSKWQKILDNLISGIVENPGEIIHYAKTPLDGRDKPIRSQQTNLGKIIARSMAYSFDDQVDCAIVNGGSIRLDDQLEGDVTSIDVFRALPFGGPIYKVSMTGSLLKRVLTFGEKARGKGAYLQRYNIQNKDSKWFVNGRKILDYKVYKVAVTDYLMRGFDIPFLTEKTKRVISVEKPSNSSELSSDIRKGVIAWLKAN